MKIFLKYFISVALWAVLFSANPAFAQEAATTNTLEEFERQSTQTTNVLLESSTETEDADNEASQAYDLLDKKRVSLDADKMDVSDALTNVAEQAEVNIVGHEALMNQITLYLHNADLLDALRIICDHENLAYQIEVDNDKPLIRVVSDKEFESKNGFAFDQNISTEIIVIKNISIADIADKLLGLKSQSGKAYIDNAHNMIAVIDSPQRVSVIKNYIKERDVPIKTETFKLHYIQGTNVVNSIQSMLTKDLGTTVLDSESNSVTVTDTESKLKSISKFIKDLDQQNKQVVVSVKIVQVTLNEEHQDGIDWEAIVSDFQKMPFDGFEPQIGTEKKNLSLGSLSEEDLSVLLDALDTVGIPNVISDSRMTVDFNEDFEISLDTHDLMLIAQNVPDSKDLQERKVKFSLYTFSAKEGYLTLKLHPEVFEDDQTSSQNEFKVEIKDSSTVIIGGLFKNVTIESMRKVPFLGDLPFLGFVFRNQGQQQLRTETVLFITLKSINKEPKNETTK